MLLEQKLQGFCQSQSDKQGQADSGTRRPSQEDEFESSSKRKALMHHAEFHLEQHDKIS